MKSKSSKGMALLIAVILAAVLSAIAASISFFSSQELLLSGSDKDSQSAFLAADTGIECGLYWDLAENFFPVPNSSTSRMEEIFCNDFSVDPTEVSDDGTESVYRFNVVGEEQQDQCASVQITKNTLGLTEIISDGYNSCLDGGRRLERTLVRRYKI